MDLDFPTNNPSAAIVWLNTQTNYDFTRWKTLVADAAVAEWTDFENVLCAVTGLKFMDLTDTTKTIAGQYSDSLKKGQHMKDNDKKKAGMEAANAILNKSSTPWKIHAIAWVHAALQVWIRRMIARRKKDVNQEKGRASVKLEASANAGQLATPSKSRKKKRRWSQSFLEATSSILHSITTKENRNERAIKSLQPRHSIVAAPPLLQTTSSPPTRKMEFAERMIEVQLTEGGKMIDYLPVCVASIIEEDYCEEKNIDIRERHLSWDKFLAILAAQDAQFKFSERTDGFFCGAEGPITEARVFRSALGVLRWDLERRESNQPLRVELRRRV